MSSFVFPEIYPFCQSHHNCHQSNHQIVHKIHHQNWWLIEFASLFGTKYVTKFSDLLYFSQVAAPQSVHLKASAMYCLKIFTQKSRHFIPGALQRQDAGFLSHYCNVSRALKQNEIFPQPSIFFINNSSISELVLGGGQRIGASSQQIVRIFHPCQERSNDRRRRRGQALPQQAEAEQVVCVAALLSSICRHWFSRQLLLVALWHSNITRLHEELELHKNFFQVLTSHLFLTDLVFSSRFSYLSASSSELHGCLLKIC